MKKRRGKFKYRRKAYVCPCSEILPVECILMSTMLITSLDRRRDYRAGNDPFEQIDFEGEVYGRSDYGAGYDPFERGDVTGRNDNGFGGGLFSDN